MVRHRSSALSALLLGACSGIAPVLTSFFLTVNDVAEAFDISDESGSGYDTWRKSGGGDAYEHSLVFPIDAEDKDKVYAFSWTIDKEAGNIHVAAAAESTGYVAFGLAESGGMPGADMVVFSLMGDGDEGGKLVDYHATDYAAPIEDSCNDWTLVGHTMSDDGLLIWEGVRNLVTGDNQDHEVVDDSAPTINPTRLIGAWGNSADGALTYHSPQNRVKFQVRLFGDNAGLSTTGFSESMAAEAEGSFFVGASKYALNNDGGGQPVVTEYKRFCFLLKDLVVDPSVEAHIIGFEPVIDNAPNLHHLILFASKNRDDCGEEDTTIVAWAVGQGPQELPKEAGFPMGGENGYHSFEIDIHYDNPAMMKGITDSSGLKVHYTTKKRTHDAGVFQVGDSSVELEGTPVGEGITKHMFSCPSGCSSFEDEVEDVTVYGQFLHMHATGTRMIQETLRDGEVMHSSSVDYYDFDQIGGFLEQLTPFQLKRGDAFRTTCLYDAKESTVFGLGSEDEMCMTFYYYYPLQSTMDGCFYSGAGSMSESRNLGSIKAALSSSLGDITKLHLKTRTSKTVDSSSMKKIGTRNMKHMPGNFSRRRPPATLTLNVHDTERRTQTCLAGCPAEACECVNKALTENDFTGTCPYIIADACDSEEVASCIAVGAVQTNFLSIMCPASLCYRDAGSDLVEQARCGCTLNAASCSPLEQLCDLIPNGIGVPGGCPPVPCEKRDCCDSFDSAEGQVACFADVEIGAPVPTTLPTTPLSTPPPTPPTTPPPTPPPTGAPETVVSSQQPTEDESGMVESSPSTCACVYADDDDRFAEPCIEPLASGCADGSVYDCTEGDQDMTWLFQNSYCPAAQCFASATEDSDFIECSCGIFEDLCTGLQELCDAGVPGVDCPPELCVIGGCCADEKGSMTGQDECLRIDPALGDETCACVYADDDDRFAGPCIEPLASGCADGSVYDCTEGDQDMTWLFQNSYCQAAQCFASATEDSDFIECSCGIVEDLCTGLQELCDAGVPGVDCPPELCIIGGCCADEKGSMTGQDECLRIDPALGDENEMVKPDDDTVCTCLSDDNWFESSCVGILAPMCRDDTIYSNMCASNIKSQVEGYICDAAICLADSGDDSSLLSCYCDINANFCSLYETPDQCDVANCCAEASGSAEAQSACLFEQDGDCIVDEYTKTELNGEEEVGRVFGTVPDQCSIEQISPSVSPNAGSVSEGSLPEDPPTASPDAGSVPVGSPPEAEPSSAVNTGAPSILLFSVIFNSIFL